MGPCRHHRALIMLFGYHSTFVVCCVCCCIDFDCLIVESAAV